MTPPDAGQIISSGEWRKLTHADAVIIAHESESSKFIETPETTLRGFEFMRYDCIDDLPDHKILPTDPNY